MNEQELRKRFRKSIFICVLLGIIILCIGISVLGIFNRSLNDIIQGQVETEADDYKRRIHRQIEKDFEALEGLAVYLDGYSPDDVSKFSKRLYDAKLTNTFVSMAYFGLDGIGVLVNEEHGIKTNVDYHTLGKNIRTIVEAAYKGESEVSSMFDSEVSEHRVFAYCVPVYNDNKTRIIGALAASNHMDVFDELINGDKILNGHGAVHLVNSNGDLLLSSTDPENTMNLTSILYSPHFFSERTQAKIKKALSNYDTVFCSMTYNGREYRVFLLPCGVNDWYIMCINNPEGVSHIAHQMVQALSITFFLLFLVIVILLIYVIRLTIKNNDNLIQIAYTDTLTSADNMIRFTKNLTREKETAKGFCLVALDIHQFKFINEIMGVQAADGILIYICECISKMLREDEFFCRESADLFYIFLRETDERMIRWKIEHLMQEISTQAVTTQKDYKIRLHAGALICLDEKEENLSNELMITRTKFALKCAKKLPATQIHFFDATIHKREEMENYVDTHMHRALENEEFHLFLQPKIDLRTGKLSGAEALVRWITEDGRMIFPDIFIPQFEENGFCIQLDKYMFNKACQQIRAWIDAGKTPIQISVNQSKLLFFDNGYIPYLETTIKKYQIPAELITLEILENLVLEHAEELNGKLRRLREIGFKISMDDFGSGYSSLNTLGSLEIDELKLDRVFLMEITTEKSSRYQKIMSHIVHLTKSLNISTVAEGVETEENEALIKSLGCDYGQGYLYSRPISSEEFSQKYM